MSAAAAANWRIDSPQIMSLEGKRIVQNNSSWRPRPHFLGYSMRWRGWHVSEGRGGVLSRLGPVDMQNEEIQTSSTQ